MRVLKYLSYMLIRGRDCDAQRLSPKLEARLNRLAKSTGRTKASCAKKAIEEFLEEQEDYFIALSQVSR